jgi:hypothetical protein
MEEFALTAKLVDKFLKGLTPNLKERAIDIILVVLTLVYQAHDGRLSLQAWKDNVWEAVTPWVWLLCGLTAYHVIKAAKYLMPNCVKDLIKAENLLLFLQTESQPVLHQLINSRYSDLC